MLTVLYHYSGSRIYHKNVPILYGVFFQAKPGTPTAQPSPVDRPLSESDAD